MDCEEKAKELYEKAKTNPEESLLMPLPFFENKQKEPLFFAFGIGNIINHYALGKHENNWVEITEETFYRKGKEGKKFLKSFLYWNKKKGYIEIEDRNGKKFLKLTTDIFFEPDLYQRQKYEEEA